MTILYTPKGKDPIAPGNPISKLERVWSGPVIVIGGGLSAKNNVDKIKSYSYKKMECCGSLDIGLDAIDFLFFSDSFKLTRRVAATPETYLFSRGYIADPDDKLLICKRHWFYWNEKLLRVSSREMFTGPVAIRCALFLGFSPVYFIGMDGGELGNCKHHYDDSKRKVTALQKEYPDIVIPLIADSN